MSIDDFDQLRDFPKKQTLVLLNPGQKKIFQNMRRL